MTAARPKVRVRMPGSPQPNRKPEQPPSNGVSLFSKCIAIIRYDIREKFHVGGPNGWEDYRQFCELARGNKMRK